MRKQRRQNRLKSYDYSQAGYYFVTICTQSGQEWFGKIEKGEMILNGYGAIAANYWEEIPDHYLNVKLEEWVIMPNHIHGIIVIEQPSFEPVGTEHCSVPTNTMSLSQIIKSFKGVTIKHLRSEFGDICFAWQRSFYDHVIRNETSLSRIREYIIDNPLKWDIDIENAKNHCNDSGAYYDRIIRAEEHKIKNP